PSSFISLRSDGVLDGTKNVIIVRVCIDDRNRLIEPQTFQFSHVLDTDAVSLGRKRDEITGINLNLLHVLLTFLVELNERAHCLPIQFTNSECRDILCSIRSSHTNFSHL